MNTRLLVMGAPPSSIDSRDSIETMRTRGAAAAFRSETLAPAAALLGLVCFGLLAVGGFDAGSLL